MYVYGDSNTLADQSSRLILPRCIFFGFFFTISISNQCVLAKFYFFCVPNQTQKEREILASPDPMGSESMGMIVTYFSCIVVCSSSP